MSVLITLCARGGSKSIPGKNIKLLNGRPLISYSVESAKAFQRKFRDVTIVLSTDSLEILRIAEQCGLKSEYRRPDHLANDSAGKIDAIRDILLWQEKKDKYLYDYILDLDITSPLRNLEDLSEAFKILQENKFAVNLFSVNPANRNPYFNMVEQKENGFFALVKQPYDTIMGRQAAPKVYDLNASFYFYKRLFFEKGYTGAITDKSLIYVMPHICFDLDHPIDFEFISYLLENKKLDFSL
jgi:CMP-N,N'-diacetyllegionaminic acid synthase